MRAYINWIGRTSQDQEFVMLQTVEVYFDKNKCGNENINILTLNELKHEKRTWTIKHCCLQSGFIV